MPSGPEKTRAQLAWRKTLTAQLQAASDAEANTLHGDGSNDAVSATGPDETAAGAMPLQLQQTRRESRAAAASAAGSLGRHLPETLTDSHVSEQHATKAAVAAGDTRRHHQAGNTQASKQGPRPALEDRAGPADVQQPSKARDRRRGRRAGISVKSVPDGMGDSASSGAHQLSPRIWQSAAEPSSAQQQVAEAIGCAGEELRATVLKALCDSVTASCHTGTWMTCCFQHLNPFL